MDIQGLLAFMETQKLREYVSKLYGVHRSSFGQLHAYQGATKQTGWYWYKFAWEGYINTNIPSEADITNDGFVPREDGIYILEAKIDWKNVGANGYLAVKIKDSLGQDLCLLDEIRTYVLGDYQVGGTTIQKCYAGRRYEVWYVNVGGDGTFNNLEYQTHFRWKRIA